MVKTPSGASQAVKRDIPDIIAIASRPSGSARSCPMCPTICTQCQAPLPAEPGPGDPEPTWHQVAELPELAANITEHQGHARTCTCCGHLNRGEIPPEIRAHVIGPRLAAVMSYLTGRHHISRRGVEEIVETVFEVPTSLGSVSALEGETSAALASPYQEVQEAVREAPVKNTDETSWKEKGKKRWLWSAATATAALFVIHLRRNFAGLQALLGEAITGIVCSDRWSVYNKLPLNLRQICWAHLKRDFQKLVDRGGPAEAIGRVGLDVVECLFADWWAFRRGELDRPGLQARLDSIARELQGVLEQGCSCADSKAATFCANLLAAISGVVVVRSDRRCRAHKQPRGTHPALGRALAEERLWLPQRGRVSIRGADVDRGPNPAVAETRSIGSESTRRNGNGSKILR